MAMNVWLRADSDNLPEVHFFMILDFLTGSLDFTSAEFGGVKVGRSARDSYGDNAMGMVELYRSNEHCFVRGKITPEHKVRIRPYSVTATINEVEHSIEECKCADCVSSQAGCKHAVAFLFWLHRRTEEPPPTSVQSYWKKSKLAQVSSGCAKVKELWEDAPQIPIGSGQLLARFMGNFMDEDSTLSNHNREVNGTVAALSLHHLSVEAKLQSPVPETSQDFREFCRTQMTLNLVIDAEMSTRDQSDNNLWHELRYGRISASRFHAASRCRTGDGSLIEGILGSALPIKTTPILRGKHLEAEVLKVVEERLQLQLEKCGLLLDPVFPIMGASPDAVGADFVVEVKCPSKVESMKRFLTVQGQPTSPYLAQIQLQMAMKRVKRGLFVVAFPDFETSKNFFHTWVEFDHQYVTMLIASATQFWDAHVFPKLVN